MNTITANTLKTLEEPPGAVKFIDDQFTTSCCPILPLYWSRWFGLILRASMAWLQHAGSRRARHR
jgi:hypothetical protein